jgi:hypothetical protein
MEGDMTSPQPPWTYMHGSIWCQYVLQSTFQIAPCSINTHPLSHPPLPPGDPANSEGTPAETLHIARHLCNACMKMMHTCNGASNPSSHTGIGLDSALAQGSPDTPSSPVHPNCSSTSKRALDVLEQESSDKLRCPQVCRFQALALSRETPHLSGTSK